MESILGVAVLEVALLRLLFRSHCVEVVVQMLLSRGHHVVNVVWREVPCQQAAAWRGVCLKLLHEGQGQETGC